jgi:hypothetical protein
MSNENKQRLDAAVEATLEQAHQAIEQTRAERICRNSFLLSAGLWSALTEEGEAGCSKAGNLIGQ